MLNIDLILERNVRRVPNREALIFGERRLTYAQLDAAVNRTAWVLKRLGLEKGDRVGLMSPNTDQFVIVFYAILKLGAVVVPINPRLAPLELAYQLTDSGSKVLVFDPQLELAVGKMSQQDVPTRHYLATLPCNGFEDVATLASNESAEPLDISVSEEDNAQILYTSGTTGLPKGVLLDHHAIIWTGTSISLGVGIREGDRLLHVAPLYHSAELNLFLMAGTLQGCTHVVLPAFEPAEVLKSLESEHISVFFGVPTMYQFLLRQPDLAEYDLDSWRIGMYGAALMPPSVVKELVASLSGVQLFNLCGLTEMGPGGIYLLPHEQMSKLGAGGKPLVNTEARVVDAEMRDVAPGQVGEWILRGETMMKGYWNQPETTAETIRDGWLFTGDLASIDAEGYITLVDRKKDMIITGGMNVYSVEVENAVQSHPAVADCAAIGIPHPDFGETVAILATLRDGQDLTLEQLRNHCLTLIADYKVPRQLFLGAVPRNPSGKILKYQIRQTYTNADQHPPERETSETTI